MSTKFFRKVYTGTQENQRLQANIEDAVSATLKNPLLDGNLLKSVALVSGDNKIAHKLARKINGYVVVKKNSAATLYDVADDESFLTINASASATISIWIF